MTNIEKQFFEAFGIEPEELEYPDNFEYYPEITDKILIELICIYIGYERIYMGIFKPDHFRRFMLSCLIDLYKEMKDVNKKEHLKRQIQKVFEGELFLTKARNSSQQ